MSVGQFCGKMTGKTEVFRKKKVPVPLSSTTNRTRTPLGSNPSLSGPRPLPGTSFRIRCHPTIRRYIVRDKPTTSLPKPNICNTRHQCYPEWGFS